MQATAKKTFNTINPANGEKIASYEFQTIDEAKKIVDFSNEVFKNEWKKLSLAQKIRFFRSLAKVLRVGRQNMPRQ